MGATPAGTGDAKKIQIYIISFKPILWLVWVAPNSRNARKAVDNNLIIIV